MTRANWKPAIEKQREPEPLTLHEECDPAQPATLCAECRAEWDKALAEAGQGTLPLEDK